MKNLIVGTDSSKDYMGCFGNFNKVDMICKKHCVLNIRCAIEHDQSLRMKMLEDLLASDEIPITTQ